MKNVKLTGFSRILIGLVIAAGLWFGIKALIPQPKIDPATGLSETEQTEVIRIGVVTWGGYAGGEYYNGGFKASKESRFFKDQGILVEFKLMDDFNASREAFKADQIDLLWQTADAFPTEINGLSEFAPKIVFQSDWSRGGDAVVVRRGLNSVADLKGKKIAVAPMTPSHTFLLSLFKAGEVSIKDVQIVEVASAIDAADLFKKKQVDAAVVWSPDDQACIEAVEGSKILINTKTAKNIIADIFFAKDKYIQSHQEQLKKLVEGWMIGAAEINGSEDKKRDAAKILAEGLGQPEDFCLGAINNARLCTIGDNVNFFNLNGSYDGVTGENLYNNMTVEYQKVGVISGSVPSWRNVIYTNAVKDVKLSGPQNLAEMGSSFAPIKEDKTNVEAISSKKVTISFSTGEYTLDDNAKYVIDKEFVDIAKGFSGARIRIEGNTDNVGNASSNQALSKKRAQSVAEYLISTHGFDKNRIVVIGNGSNKPVDNSNTDDGRSKNRRTDFELIPE
jgi:NitT/TauT family transport system substrate-binding protein